MGEIEMFDPFLYLKEFNCAMDNGIIISEFELKSRYYVHFRTNALRKDMDPLILPAMG